MKNATRLRACAGLTLAGIILACSAGPAAGQDKLPTPDEQDAYQEKLFKAIDANNDGRVTEKEFVVAILYDTFKAHADRNGRISREKYFKEAPNYPEIDARKEWALMDSENKGYITFEDVMQNTIAIKDMEKAFLELDKKRRGYITMADLPDLDD